MLLARLCLLASEYNHREKNLEQTPLTEMLLRLGEVRVAIDRLREGQQLRVPDLEALHAAVALVEEGLADEAERIFSLAEPLDILANPTPIPSREHDEPYRFSARGLMPQSISDPWPRFRRPLADFKSMRMCARSAAPPPVRFATNFGLNFVAHCWPLQDGTMPHPSIPCGALRTRPATGSGLKYTSGANRHNLVNPIGRWLLLKRL